MASGKKSYESLPTYRAELLSKIPGSIVEMDTDEFKGDICFKRFFIALKPCIDGFLGGCKPYIAMDSNWFLQCKWTRGNSTIWESDKSTKEGRGRRGGFAYWFAESEWLVMHEIICSTNMYVWDNMYVRQYVGLSHLSVRLWLCCICWFKPLLCVSIRYLVYTYGSSVSTKQGHSCNFSVKQVHFYNFA